jgi:M6 family metalloprotease-like protein
MRISFAILAVAAFVAASPVSHARPASAAPAVQAALPRAGARNIYQRRSLERLLGATPSRVDSLRVIVFRVSFADRDFSAAHDVTYAENELANVREYFAGASRGIFHMTTDLFPTIVKLGGTEAYYGTDDLWAERMAALLIQVVGETDASIDFSRYDAVAVIHAGAGQETDFNGDSPEQVASGFVDPAEMAAALEDTLGTPGVPTNDVVGGDTLYVDNLMVWPEDASQDGYTFGSLGIYAYQVGLRLGMIPLYDTTPEDFPDSQGLGNFDLMSYGIYNALGFVPAFPSAFNRLLMGWLEPVVVDRDASVRLADVNSASMLDTALVKIPLNPSEYYLVENRVHDTNFNGKFDFNDSNGNGVPENGESLLGAEFDFFLTATTDLQPKPDSIVTGSGLMVYHVDESAIRRALASGGNVEDDSGWKGVDVEEADHIQDLDSPSGAFAYGSFYDSFRKGNNDRFGPGTDPSTADNAGVRTGIELDGISVAGHFMTFRTSFSPAMDVMRGEFAADIGRLSPLAIHVPAGLGNHERLVLAADSGSIYLADVGLAAWDGTVEKLNITNGGAWASSPLYAHLTYPDRDALYLTSAGGILHACDSSGAPLPIDDDDTPGTLALHGDEVSTLIVEPGGARLLAFSSNADSTYLMIVGTTSAPSGASWVRRGPIAFETALMEGRIASHPALGHIRMNDAAVVRGAYIVTYEAARGLCFNFVPIDTLPLSAGARASRAVSIDPAGIITKEAGVRETPGSLLTISTGDIDGDGSDEMVAAVDGAGLFYYTAGGAVRHVPLPGSRFSSPVLSDVDRDGTLETALRDESRCFLLSGFGVAARGWPLELPGGAFGHEEILTVPAPVVCDVDGDDAREILFLAAGDSYAFDVHGRVVGGWPLAGEGSRGGSLTILEGEEGKLYIVDCAAVSRTAGAGARGPISSIRRYDPGVEAHGDGQSWRMYRHDPQGSARQNPAAAIAGPRPAHVDPSTFIVYPNPVTGGTFTARLVVSDPARVKVTILDIEGEKVLERERDHDWPRGSAVPFEASFPALGLASGVYLCRVEATGAGWSWTGTKRFAVVR